MTAFTLDADKLKRSLGAMFFELRIQQVRTAFLASMEALEVRAGEAEGIVRSRWGMSAIEGPPEVTFDPEEGPSPDFWSDVGDLESELVEAASMVSVAFTITLFHAFEKLARAWTGTYSYRHRKVIDHLQALGVSADADGLQALQLSANAAKHGPGEAMNDLKAYRPDLVHHDEVVVSRDQMDQFFQAVLSASPRG